MTTPASTPWQPGGRKPAIIRETVDVKWREPDAVAKLLGDEWAQECERFKDKQLRLFFTRGATRIFGKYASNLAFRLQLETLAGRREWGVHFIVPLRAGGSTSESNMVVMPQALGEEFEEKLRKQLEAPDLKKLRIERPRYKVHLERSNGKLQLPVVDDNGNLASLNLPLGQYSAQQFQDQGFRSLQRAVVNNRSSRRPKVRDDFENVETCVTRRGVRKARRNNEGYHRKLVVPPSLQGAR